MWESSQGTPDGDGQVLVPGWQPPTLPAGSLEPSPQTKTGLSPGTLKGRDRASLQMTTPSVHPSAGVLNTCHRPDTETNTQNFLGKASLPLNLGDSGRHLRAVPGGGRQGVVSNLLEIIIQCSYFSFNQLRILKNRQKESILTLFKKTKEDKRQFFPISVSDRG